MSNVQLFDFKSHQIRVVEINGAPWFVAKDVCSVLGLVNTTLALRPLDSTEKGLNPIKTLGGVQNLNCISESGLYKLVMRSDKPEAKGFQDWVTKTAELTITQPETSATVQVTQGAAITALCVW